MTRTFFQRFVWKEAKKKKKIVATTLVVVMVLMLFPAEVMALAVNHKIQVNTKPVDVIKERSNAKDIVYSGQWDVKVRNSKVAEGIGVKALLNNKDAPNYIFIPTSSTSVLSKIVDALGGEWGFVSGRYEDLITQVDGRDTIYISFLAHLCGADPGRWQANNDEDGGGYQEINTTPSPSASISAPSSVKAGESVRINVRANTYVKFSHPQFTPVTNLFADRIKVSVEIDGKEVHYDNVRSRNYSKTITYTFDEPGKYTIRATAEDVVERSKTTTATINVTSSPSPPSKPGTIDADLEMTLNPSQIKTGKTETVLVSLDASRVKTPGTGPVHYRWWVKKNGQYINEGGSAGYKNEADPSNPRYNLYAYSCKPGDVIWAEVKAYDMSILKDATADTQRTIGELGEDPPDLPPPPPPEPPEPENIPPVARFSMPRKTGQGTTVDVRNRSYDRDGEIVWVDWSISPRTGVEDNLGFDGGTITFNETGTYRVRLEVEDDRGDYDSTTETIEVTNEPPEAIISCPDEVIQGEDVTIRSRSYDPDGEIASIKWDITPKEGVMGELEGEESEVWFDKVGEYKITLTVEDMFGLTDTTEKTITVKPAIPVAYFDYIGPLKENRKLVLDASHSTTSDRYPMVWEDTQWDIIPPHGVSSENVKIANSPDMQKRSVLFKKPGDYTVRVRVKNTAGHYSEWYERTLTITPDLPPVAEFYVQFSVLREHENNNKARIELIDSSYSPDGDYIAQRIWKYKYDSDNDGSFDDEEWQILDEGNNITPVLHTDQVGRYYFELTVKEEFGEETIPEFITEEDIKEGNTLNKHLEDKMTEVLNLQPVVDFEMARKPKVDVVFTVGKTDSDKIKDLNGKITSIVSTKLAANNFDSSISAVETASMSTEHQNPSIIFSNWISFYVGSSGTPPSHAWSYDTSLDAVVCNLGNRPALGWYNPDAFNTKDFTVNYKLGIRSDATAFEHGEMGFMFRMQDRNNYYVYIIDNHSACGNVRYDQRSVLAKVQNGSFTVIKTGSSFPYFHRGQVWNIRIEVKGNNIKIYREGSLDIEWTDTSADSYNQGSYGFYVWDQPSAYFKDIQITTENIKTLDEALKTTTWRDNSVRFVVNISDVELPELNDSTKRGQILAGMFSNDIYFIGLGTDSNKTLYEDFIKKNDGKGMFHQNSNMNTALTKVADYIVEIVKSMPNILQQYVLLGEEVIYKTYYIDPEQDAEYTREWYYDHDPDYFENSLGLAPYSGLPLAQEINVFDKVGKFDVVFRAKDNPKDDNRFDNYRLWSYMPLNKLEIYVHRKPIAQYIASITGSGATRQLTLTSTSYDLDHMSEPNRGIVEEEWKWKEDTATTWNIGKPTTMPQDKVYLVWLRVKDKEGAWSDPHVRALSTVNENLPPVAMFTVNPSTQVEGRAIEITDQSYDPNGDPIAEWRWRVRKGGGSWSDYGSKVPTDIPSLGEGVYTIELTVRDNPKTGTSLWSEPFTQTVTVIPENQKPVARFTIGPAPIIADEPYTITDNSYDPDDDPIVAREWRIQKPGGSWHIVTQLKPTFEEMGFDDDGTYRIQLRVLDDPSGRHPALTPMWSDPHIVTVQVESPLKVIGDTDKDTYKAGQAMLLSAETEGKAYRVEARMWYPKNEYSSTNVTTLVPDTTLTDPPQKFMTWHSRRTKEEGRDIVVIIPLNTPDGTYPVKFTAYKRKADGSTKTAEDTIYVKVKGTIYDYSHSEIIGK